VVANNKITKLSNETLLKQYRDTEKSEYLGELYKRHIPLVYGVCLKYTKDAEAAEDAAMQIYDELPLKINSDVFDSFRVWLYSTVKNYCVMLLQKENRKIPINDSDYENLNYDDIIYLLEKENNYEKTKKLKQCMEKLPNQQRISLIYFFMDELSYEEISDKTGYTLNHVAEYIRDGIKNLGKQLENIK
jgi:RNA polymerase sigma-70 factor (ECF subfamily)